MYHHGRKKDRFSSTTSLDLKVKQSVSLNRCLHPFGGVLRWTSTSRRFRHLVNIFIEGQCFLRSQTGIFIHFPPQIRPILLELESVFLTLSPTNLLCFPSFFFHFLFVFAKPRFTYISVFYFDDSFFYFHEKHEWGRNPKPLEILLLSTPQ